jgi:hypothetical protein
VSVSPSASEPEAVSHNGVRSGIVYWTGAVTVGMALPVALTAPPRVVGPPFAISPTEPVQLLQLTSSSSSKFVFASVPPKLIVKAVSLTVVTVAVPPAGQPVIPSIAASIPRR